MADQDPEHAELRRRAFSRDGTDDDRRRLAEFETRRSAGPSVSRPTPHPAIPTPAATSAEDVDSEPVPRVSSRRRLLVAAAIGLAAGILGTAVVVAASTPPPEPEPEPVAAPETLPLEVSVQLIDEPSLARFDEPATEADLIPDEAWLAVLRRDDPDAEVRLLGTSGDVTVYGARLDIEGTGHVCLYTRRPTSGSATCVTLGDFEVNGLEHRDAGLFEWGPLGPPYLVVTF